MNLTDKLAECGLYLDSDEIDPYSDIFTYYLIDKLEAVEPFFVVTDGRDYIIKGSWVDGRRAWITAGNWMLEHKDYHNALLIFESMYAFLSSPKCLGVTQERGVNQEQSVVIAYKADCLRGMASAHRSIGQEYLANRAIVLALIDEVRSPNYMYGYSEETGDLETEYEMLTFGFSKSEISTLRNEITNIKKTVPDSMWGFPEYVLQELSDSRWHKCYPSKSELLIYQPNTAYIEALRAATEKTDEDNKLDGRSFEFLVEYLFQLIPGCKTSRRRITHETDFDIWCQLDGVMQDFRKELGHYWLVECKNWKGKVGFTEVAKFALVLISVNCKFGIMFSREGISSGRSNFEDAQRAVVKLYQNAEIVIAVIDKSAFDRILSGESLINLLQQAYETVRFDFPNKDR